MVLQASVLRLSTTRITNMARLSFKSPLLKLMLIILCFGLTAGFLKASAEIWQLVSRDSNRMMLHVETSMIEPRKIPKVGKLTFFWLRNIWKDSETGKRRAAFIYHAINCQSRDLYAPMELRVQQSDGSITQNVSKTFGEVSSDSKDVLSVSSGPKVYAFVCPREFQAYINNLENKGVASELEADKRLLKSVTVAGEPENKADNKQPVGKAVAKAQKAKPEKKKIVTGSNEKNRSKQASINPETQSDSPIQAQPNTITNKIDEKTKAANAVSTKSKADKKPQFITRDPKSDSTIIDVLGQDKNSPVNPVSAKEKSQPLVTEQPARSLPQKQPVASVAGHKPDENKPAYEAVSVKALNGDKDKQTALKPQPKKVVSVEKPDIKTAQPVKVIEQEPMLQPVKQAELAEIKKPTTIEAKTKQAIRQSSVEKPPMIDPLEALLNEIKSLNQ